MAKQIRKKATKSFVLEQEMLDAIKRWAEHSGRTQSDVIRLLLLEGLKVVAVKPEMLGTRPAPVDPDSLTPPQPVYRKGKPT